MSALEAYAMGLESCRLTTPRPDCDASHEMVTGLVTSKYARTGCFKDFLDFLKGLFLGLFPLKNSV